MYLLILSYFAHGQFYVDMYEQESYEVCQQRLAATDADMRNSDLYLKEHVRYELKCTKLNTSE